MQPDAGSELRITTELLPPGRIGTAYEGRIEATGGAEPYVFSIAQGTLPSGLSLAEDGTLSGAPLVTGTSRMTFQVTDGAARTATAELSIKVLPDAGEVLEITTVVLPDGALGLAYDALLEARGGATPHVWSLASGSLPAGLSLSPEGRIAGTPSSIGSSTFLVQVTDASDPQQQATSGFTIIVQPAEGTALEIVTRTLPGGALGQAYGAALVASGGTEPYTWSLAGGTTLPGGLVLSADGTITGTPSASGSTTFSVQVLDGSSPQQIATAQLSIAIEGAVGSPLAIATSALPDAQLGVAYATTITATGGAAPYGFSVQGLLPAGLSLAADGALSGVPSESGSFSFTVQVDDGSVPAQVATRSFTLTVLSDVVTVPLSIATAALPDGLVGATYDAALAAAGGTPPYQWALDPASTLPAGLALSSDGRISGTPAVSGRFAFSVIAADASLPQQTASAALTLTIAPPAGATLAIVTGTLPAATSNLSYTAALQATGGAAPYSWSIVAGALPAGISLAGDGSITGTSTLTGSFGFTVEVSDQSNPAQVAQASLALTVVPAPGQLAIITAALPRAVAGSAYRGQLAASGGTTPYVWSLAAGSLPLGLTLTSTGAIVGTTTIAGSFGFTARVTDASSPQQLAERALTITTFASPGSGLAILNQTLHRAVTGAQYQANIAAAGGVRPYAFSISAGALPPGFAIDAVTGRISGVATSTGTFAFTVRVTDSGTPQLSSERRYTITVASGTRALRVTSRTLPAAQVNVAYRAQLTAIGGRPPYTWTLASGTLPAGLMLAPSGELSGTPSAPGRVSFVVQVADAAATTAQRSVTVTVR